MKFVMKSDYRKKVVYELKKNPEFDYLYDVIWRGGKLTYCKSFVENYFAIGAWVKIEN